MKISVTIITLNEEQHISRAIKSVSFADEVIVVDSGSVDKTVEMARTLGAKVFHHPFEGYGQQKNYAASLCQNDWILNIDADEEVTPELAAEIKTAVSAGKFKVFSINRRNHYCGKPINHGGWYPDEKRRLSLRNFAKWSEPHVHEDLIPIQNTEVGNLKSDINHFTFTTIYGHIKTNLKYASLGSQELVNKKGKPLLLTVILKPFWKFIECYFLKLGLLDGFYGFVIAINAAHSIFLKYLFAYQGEKHV